MQQLNGKFEAEFFLAVVCAVLSAYRLRRRVTSAEDRGLYRLILVAAWKFLVPFPCAFDNRFQRLELRSPTEFFLNLF